MKTFIVFALLVAIAAAAPRKHSSQRKYTKAKHAVEPTYLVEPPHVAQPERSEPGQILRFENDNIGVGPYNFV